jgi:hypothetical protein
MIELGIELWNVLTEALSRDTIRINSDCVSYDNVRPCEQGCQMVVNQNLSLGIHIFWRALEGRVLGVFEYLGPFGICYDQFGILYHEKSGNPGIEPDFVQTGL